jgi:hypothetical protein
MHNAEQQIARMQSLLNAVRDIHPGSIRRIEKMCAENNILAAELQDVVDVHIAQKALEKAKAAKEKEEKVLAEHMQIETEENQLLLRRVKWVLSRLNLNYDYEQVRIEVSMVYVIYTWRSTRDCSWARH